MADEDKAKSAKERLEAAKAAAEEAEFSDDAASAVKPDDDSPDAAKGETPDADAAEAPPESDASEDKTGEDGVAPDGSDETKTDDPKPDADEAPKEDEAEDLGREAAGAAAVAAAAAITGDGRRGDGDEPTGDAAEPEPEPHHEAHDEHDDHHDADEHRSATSLSALILRYLAILVVGAIVALWAAPRIAPSLPGWAAPVANFLTPGANQAEAQIDAIRSDTETKLAEIAARLSEVEATAGEDAIAKAGAVENRLVSVEAALAEQIEAVAAEPRADLARMDDLAKRLAQSEAKLAGLLTEVETLAGFTGENAAPSAETLERVAAFGAAVEGLRAEIAVLSEQAAQIESKASGEVVADLAERVAALESGEAATSGAQDAAETIRRSAGIEAALTRLDAAVKSGASYADALDSAVRLSGLEAPELLASFAQSGLPTQESLLRSFPAAAQRAYAAALAEDADEGLGSQVLAAVRGRLGGRPATETEGDDAGAILSRIEARLDDGALEAALAEANTLSDGAYGAMAGWANRLATAVNARSALDEFSALLGAN